MVEVTRKLADQIAEAAELLAGEDDSDPTLDRLTRLAVEIIPGGTAAALTVEGDQRALTFAASDPRIEELHDLQFESGQGPAVEALHHNEPRNVDDISAENRWPAFCRAAAEAGFASCLMLPLRTDRRPAGAVSLYGTSTNAFRGTSHDLALLFAAQGGTAVNNAALYQTCSEMVSNLHTALESRAVIEQAKGILHATVGISTDDAFRLMARRSQNTNRKVRDIAADIVRGDFDRGQFGPAH
jgi:GAF domain-containing protein